MIKDEILRPIKSLSLASMILTTLVCFAMNPAFVSIAYADDAGNERSSVIAAIQEADRAGADTRELVNRLNAALDQANSNTTCAPSDDCLNNLDSFNQIEDVANILRQQAIQASYTQLVGIETFAIIVSFVIAFVIALLYHYRDSIQLSRCLRIASLTRKR